MFSACFALSFWSHGSCDITGQTARWELVARYSAWRFYWRFLWCQDREPAVSCLLREIKHLFQFKDCYLNTLSKMVRKLKYHEHKLLKKVDFVNWDVDKNIHEVKVLRKYRVDKREDYTKYNKLSRNIRVVARKIRDLDDKDRFRISSTTRLLEKIYGMGLIPTKQSLQLCEMVSASSFCRRRLPTIAVKLRMAQNLRTAIMFIEQGHIRVGPEAITDPAYLVTRYLSRQILLPCFTLPLPLTCRDLVGLQQEHGRFGDVGGIIEG
uniref:Small ribosomal subunit protein uS4 N-terminal domain-containing protein n=1 Tax=Leptobrachium leishanense TaxID=445787 RepID=A0A8C5WHL2_9ANUR